MPYFLTFQNGRGTALLAKVATKLFICHKEKKARFVKSEFLESQPNVNLGIAFLYWESL